MPAPSAIGMSRIPGPQPNQPVSSIASAYTRNSSIRWLVPEYSTSCPPMTSVRVVSLDSPANAFTRVMIASLATSPPPPTTTASVNVSHRYRGTAKNTTAPQDTRNANCGPRLTEKNTADASSSGAARYAHFFRVPTQPARNTDSAHGSINVSIMPL